MAQAEAITRARRTALWIFGVASLLAIVLGSVAMAQADVPASIWIRNPIAWLVAGVLSIFLASRGWLGSALPPIAVIVLALSLLGPGQEGVHRWLDLGPVQLNAAALVLPAAIVAIDRAPATLAIPSLLLIAALLAWQPDISQLAGFSLAALVIVPMLLHGKLMLAAAAVIAVALLALCLSRPDPLAPVAHVEGILGLAWSQSPVLAIVMATSLAAAALSPLAMWSAHPPGMTAPLALAAYLATTALAPLFGAYPVPLGGYGLSFVMGWVVGYAALVTRRPADSHTVA